MSSYDTVVLDGEFGLFTKITQSDLPYYTGATEVTPSTETQTLATAETIVMSNITVNPIPELELQDKSVSPTEESQTVTADSGYDALGEVTVGAISSTYVGSGIDRNDSDDLTASGATVTAPSGYYAESASKTVASGSATTPATSITANPSISVDSNGLITATASATKSVTPTVVEGYVSSGTAGTITVSGSATEQLTVKTSSDLTASGATVTAPAGFYAESASKTIASGTEGTPTATKGSVSNHSVSVTPSVTNVAGYISGGTHTGTAVTVSASELASGNKEIVANGTNIDVVGYSTVSVAVPGETPTLETVTASYTPTESQQTDTITPSSGYDGIAEVDVTIGAIADDYVGSAIDRNDSTDLTSSGATITAPAGYYASAASKSVASGSASTPATSITANPSISVNANTGVITATASASQSVTPTVSAGYVASGAAGTVTVSGSATEQLTTQAAQTITPSNTAQTAVAAGKYTTGATTVEAVVCSNLTAENIVQGVTVKVGTATDDDSVASVTGTASGGGGSETLNALIDRSITSVSSSATSVGHRAFDSCKSLSTISLPNAITLATGAFAACSALRDVIFPSVQNFTGGNCFESSGITTAVFPAFGTGSGGNSGSNVGNWATGSVFTNCSSLTAADFQAPYRLGGGNAFSGCQNLTLLILRRSDAIVRLDNVNAFNNTPFKSGGTGGTIYIPKALYDHLGDGTSSDYQSATNWATVYGYGTITWQKIEGSIYETQYADGTAIPTS